jgi:hypothetical protein
MLSNLSINMKVLIGISSITLLGILYSVIKNYFKTPKKMVEGQEENKAPIINKENIKLIEINENLNGKINELNNMFNQLLEITKEHHKIYRTNMYNTLFNNNIRYTNIHISQLNSSYSTGGILTLNDKELLGFSVNGLNVASVIYKNSIFSDMSNTKYIRILDNLSNLSNHITDELILAVVPITSSTVNYHQLDDRHHPIIPEIINTFEFKIVNQNNSPISSASMTEYYIDVEIMHVTSLELFSYLKDIYGLYMLNSNDLEEITISEPVPFQPS